MRKQFYMTVFCLDCRNQTMITSLARLAMSGKPPYPEHDSLVTPLKNDLVLWSEIIKAEKDVQERTESLKYLSGHELYDQIEYLESRSDSPIATASHKIVINAANRGVKIMQHEIIICIRFHARSDLDFL